MSVFAIFAGGIKIYADLAEGTFSPRTVPELKPFAYLKMKVVAFPQNSDPCIQGIPARDALCSVLNK